MSTYRVESEELSGHLVEVGKFFDAKPSEISDLTNLPSAVKTAIDMLGKAVRWGVGLIAGLAAVVGISMAVIVSIDNPPIELLRAAVGTAAFGLALAIAISVDLVLLVGKTSETFASLGVSLDKLRSGRLKLTKDGKEVTYRPGAMQNVEQAKANQPTEETEGAKLSPETTSQPSGASSPESLSGILESKLGAAFPRFLSGLAQLQPLAFFFSVSIAVATFSLQASKGAFVWGMAAAFSFGLALLTAVATPYPYLGPRRSTAPSDDLPGRASGYLAVYVGAAAGFVSLGAVLVAFATERPELPNISYFLVSFVFSVSFVEIDHGHFVRLRKMRAHMSQRRFSMLKYFCVGTAVVLLVGPFFILKDGLESQMGPSLILIGLLLLLVLWLLSKRMQRRYGGSKGQEESV